MRGAIGKQQKARPVLAGTGLFVAVDSLPVMRVVNTDACLRPGCRLETNLRLVLGKTARLPHIVSVFNN